MRLLHARDDVAAVLALEHEHAGADNLAAAVARHRALARRRAGVDLAELADAHGRVCPRRSAHEGRGDVLDAAEARVAAEHDLLAAAARCTRRPTATLSRSSASRTSSTRDGVGGEARRIERDAVLLHRPAVADDLDDAAELPEARRDLPLDDGAELLGRARHGAGRLELEHVDLAERRGHGAELRHADLGRDRVAHADEALVGLGAREVDVDVVVEDERDERDPEPRHAPRELEARDAGHRALERLRDLRLDLGRRERGRARDDLHLHVRHVGDGVDGDARRRRRCPATTIADGEHQRDEAVLGGPADEALIGA